MKNLSIATIKIPAHTKRITTNADGVQMSIYSNVALGVIQGKARTIPAIIADGVVEKDTWFVFNINNCHDVAIDSVAVIGCTSDTMAKDWINKQIIISMPVGFYCTFVGQCSAHTLQRYLDRAGTATGVKRISMDDLNYIERQITGCIVKWDGEVVKSHSIDELYSDLVDYDRNNALLDPMTGIDLADYIIATGGEVETYDAIITQVGKLDALKQRMATAMSKTGANVTVANVTESKPFKRNGVTNIAVIYELNDGQTCTIVLHNPDSTPAKLAQTDTLTSWKFMLNKRDITGAVSPENGQDVKPEVLAKRMMLLVERNSARFARTNKNKAQQVQELTDTLARVETKTADVVQLKAEIDGLLLAIDKASKEKPVVEEEQAFKTTEAIGESIDINMPITTFDAAETAKNWDNLLGVNNGNKADTCKQYFKTYLQGKYVPTKVGKVWFNGKSFDEFKFESKKYPQKLLVIPYTPDVLLNPDNDNLKIEALNHARSEKFIGFYRFSKMVLIGDTKYKTSIKAGVYPSGNNVAYSLNAEKGKATSIERVSPSGDTSSYDGAYSVEHYSHANDKVALDDITPQFDDAVNTPTETTLELVWDSLVVEEVKDDTTSGDTKPEQNVEANIAQDFIAPVSADPYQADRTYLQSVIDGNEKEAMKDGTIGDNLTEAYNRIEASGDKDMLTLVNDAITAYSDYMEKVFKNGGVFDSAVSIPNITMTDMDINRMTGDDHEFEVFSDRIEYNGKVVGRYNAKTKKVTILGKKDKSNPLLLWLAENSFLSNDVAHSIIYDSADEI